MDPSIGELSKGLAETRQLVLSGQTALNIVWTLVTGFLVMFMQAGFALVETGLTRAKNVAHTMGMNFLVYSIGIIGFWALGFGLQMGGVGAMSTFGNDPVPIPASVWMFVEQYFKSITIPDDSEIG